MPLAHILAPQIAKRAEEIEAELGYAPAQGGYLQAGYGGAASNTVGTMQGVYVNPKRGSTPSAAQAFKGAKPEGPVPSTLAPTVRKLEARKGNDQPAIDNEQPVGAFLGAMGAMQGSKDQGQQAFAQGAMRGSTLVQDPNGKLTGKAGTIYFPKDNKQLIPNAPAPQQATPVPARRGYLALPSGPIGMTESGMPVQGPNTQPRTVTLPTGTVGMSESGQAVDRKGKKGGFLAQQGSMRTLERGRGDVVQQDMDAFAQKTLEKMYGEDLQAYEEQGGKFEKGYFDGVDKERAKNIRDGVKELARRKKGVRT